jgi:hypothetical protein
MVPCLIREPAGFVIKQNLYSAVLNKVVSYGLQRYLNGDAEWSQLQTVESSSGGFALRGLQLS